MFAYIKVDDYVYYRSQAKSHKSKLTSLATKRVLTC